jgi:predicted nuclease of predicted toxin-antitoxin system
MGTLSSELWPFAGQLSEAPRVYVDANVPAGLVAFMRLRLNWNVFFVMEQDGLRRAADVEHFRLAAQLHRTLFTLDRDYLDDQRFPPEASSGVVVMSAPHEEQFERMLRQIDEVVFQRHPSDRDDSLPATSLPLAGRKLHLHVDWKGDLE